jgi:hypothetical protein
MTTISALKHTEPTASDGAAGRPRPREPAGPPLPRSDHPKSGFYRKRSRSEGGDDQPAAANGGSYL